MEDEIRGNHLFKNQPSTIESYPKPSYPNQNLKISSPTSWGDLSNTHNIYWPIACKANGECQGPVNCLRDHHPNRPEKVD